MGQLKVFPEQAVVGLALKLGIITLTKQPQYVDMLSIGAIVMAILSNPIFHDEDQSPRMAGGRALAEWPGLPALRRVDQATR